MPFSHNTVQIAAQVGLAKRKPTVQTLVGRQHMLDYAALIQPTQLFGKEAANQAIAVASRVVTLASQAIEGNEK